MKANNIQESVKENRKLHDNVLQVFSPVPLSFLFPYSFHILSMKVNDTLLSLDMMISDTSPLFPSLTA